MMTVQLDNVLKESLLKLNHSSKFEEYLEYLHSEWLNTVEDLYLASTNELTWQNLKIPARLKIELIAQLSSVHPSKQSESKSNHYDSKYDSKQDTNEDKSNEVNKLNRNHDWVMYYSTEHEAYYYYNTVTYESSWDCPDDTFHYEYQEYTAEEGEYSEEVGDNASVSSPNRLFSRPKAVIGGSKPIFHLSPEIDMSKRSNPNSSQNNKDPSASPLIRKQSSKRVIKSNMYQNSDSSSSDSDDGLNNNDPVIIITPRTHTAGNASTAGNIGSNNSASESVAAIGVGSTAGSRKGQNNSYVDTTTGKIEPIYQYNDNYYTEQDQHYHNNNNNYDDNKNSNKHNNKHNTTDVHGQFTTTRTSSSDNIHDYNNSNNNTSNNNCINSGNNNSGNNGRKTLSRKGKNNISTHGASFYNDTTYNTLSSDTITDLNRQHSLSNDSNNSSFYNNSRSNSNSNYNIRNPNLHNPNNTNNNSTGHFDANMSMMSMRSVENDAVMNKYAIQQQAILTEAQRKLQREQTDLIYARTQLRQKQYYEDNKLSTSQANIQINNTSNNNTANSNNYNNSRQNSNELQTMSSYDMYAELTSDNNTNSRQNHNNNNNSDNSSRQNLLNSYQSILNSQNTNQNTKNNSTKSPYVSSLLEGAIGYNTKSSDSTDSRNRNINANGVPTVTYLPYDDEPEEQEEEGGNNSWDNDDIILDNLQKSEDSAEFQHEKSNKNDIFVDFDDVLIDDISNEVTKKPVKPPKPAHFVGNTVSNSNNNSSNSTEHVNINLNVRRDANGNKQSSQSAGTEETEHDDSFYMVRSGEPTSNKNSNSGTINNNSVKNNTVSNKSNTSTVASSHYNSGNDSGYISSNSSINNSNNNSNKSNKPSASERFTNLLSSATSKSLKTSSNKNNNNHDSIPADPKIRTKPYPKNGGINYSYNNYNENNDFKIDDDGEIFTAPNAIKPDIIYNKSNNNSINNSNNNSTSNSASNSDRYTNSSGNTNSYNNSYKNSSNNSSNNSAKQSAIMPPTAPPITLSSKTRSDYSISGTGTTDRHMHKTMRNINTSQASPNPDRNRNTVSAESPPYNPDLFDPLEEEKSPGESPQHRRFNNAHGGSSFPFPNVHSGNVHDGGDDDNQSYNSYGNRYNNDYTGNSRNPVLEATLVSDGNSGTVHNGAVGNRNNYIVTTNSAENSPNLGNNREIDHSSADNYLDMAMGLPSPPPGPPKKKKSVTHKITKMLGINSIFGGKGDGSARQPRKHSSTEVSVQSLIAMGFDRKTAQRALIECKYDLEMATEVLFALKDDEERKLGVESDSSDEDDDN